MRKAFWLIVSAALIIGSVAPRADEPRKIDFTQVIANLDNKPYTECSEVVDATTGKCPDGKEINLTLGHIVSRALISRYQDEKDISLDEQSTRGFLAMKLYKAKDATLNADQVVLIKKLVAKMGLLTIIGARVCVALDPACMPK